MVNTNRVILQRTGHSMEYLIKSNIRGILNMTKKQFYNKYMERKMRYLQFLLPKGNMHMNFHQKYYTFFG